MRNVFSTHSIHLIKSLVRFVLNNFMQRQVSLCSGPLTEPIVTVSGIIDKNNGDLGNRFESFPPWLAAFVVCKLVLAVVVVEV